MDALRIGLPRGFDIAGLPPRSLLNSPMRLFLASGALRRAAWGGLGPVAKGAGSWELLFGAGRTAG